MNHLETEIKLAWKSSAGEARAHIEARGYSSAAGREFEADSLFDRADAAGSRELQTEKKVLRLRRVAGNDGEFLGALITYKGGPQKGPHKTREEIEFGASDPDAAQLVLERLGFQVSFRYEKYRTTFIKGGTKNDETGIITLDETPIGVYLEIEGPADWIDRTARELGFTVNDYVTASYATLYAEHRKKYPEAPADMIFV